MNEKAKKPWFEEIVHAVDNVKGPAKLKSFLDVDVYPQWLINVCAELFQQAVPSGPIKGFKLESSKSVGLWLGQNIANFYAVGEHLQKSIQVSEQNPDALKKYMVSLEANKTRPEVKNLLWVSEIAGRMMMRLGKNAYDLEKITLRAFKLALDQENYQEAADFFQGFARGISKRGLKDYRLARNTDATNIYMAMFYNWETVGSFTSVSMLRKFLLQIGFTESQLGDPERLKKLCYRVKYRPGKRGRPSKNEK